jgi:hypothetical protein
MTMSSRRVTRQRNGCREPSGARRGLALLRRRRAAPVHVELWAAASTSSSAPRQSPGCAKRCCAEYHQRGDRPDMEMRGEPAALPYSLSRTAGRMPGAAAAKTQRRGRPHHGAQKSTTAKG